MEAFIKYVKVLLSLLNFYVQLLNSDIFDFQTAYQIHV